LFLILSSNFVYQLTNKLLTAMEDPRPPQWHLPVALPLLDLFSIPLCSFCCCDLSFGKSEIIVFFGFETKK
jgi:hypothetical protein